MSKNTAIILNGTSSAGKSSVAKALQQEFLKKAQPFLHFKMDTIWHMMPEGTSLKDFPHLLDVAIQSANVAVQHGNNVIIDVYCPQPAMDTLTACFNNQTLYMIAVKADLETLRAREKARGDRELGLAEWQMPTAHKDISYNLEINTSNLTPEAAAQKIVMNFDIYKALKPNA